MANDLFKMPKHRDRGFLAELMLKEIMRRGMPKSDGETKLDEANKKAKESEMKAKAEKEKQKNSSEKDGN